MDRLKPSPFYIRNFREYRRRDARSRIPAHDLLSRDFSKLKIEYDFLEQCLHQEEGRISPPEESEEDFDGIDEMDKELQNQLHVYAYQLDVMREDQDEFEDNLYDVRRDLRDKSRAYELLTRDYEKLKSEYEFLQECLEQRDQLLEDNGLAAVEVGDLDVESSPVPGNGTQRRSINSNGSGSDSKNCDESCVSSINYEDDSESGISGLGSTIDHHTTSGLGGSIESLLSDMKGSSLDKKVETVLCERNSLLEEVKNLREELESERNFNNRTEDLFIANHCPDPDLCQHSEKMILEYRRAMDIAETEVAKLQANLSRLDGILEKFRNKVELAEEHEKVLQDEKRQTLREIIWRQ
ncbi:leucine-rich repeat flightless-interacting protein 2-like isoform X2 [Brevipalpus obovatus]|uniref:leucine-rich repeat flightless-interacting protein 2-like isoform X2 n=1 Tax=Brevipalpus obovatus TaxID=246614 RepID=UPI003D9EFFBB